MSQPPGLPDIDEGLRTELLQSSEEIAEKILSGKICGLVILSLTPTGQVVLSIRGIHVTQAMGMLDLGKILATQTGLGCGGSKG